MSEIVTKTPVETCPHCQYQWEYKGMGVYVKCPRCGKYHHKADNK